MTKRERKKKYRNFYVQNAIKNTPKQDYVQSKDGKIYVPYNNVDKEGRKTGNITLIRLNP